MGSGPSSAFWGWLICQDITEEMYDDVLQSAPPELQWIVQSPLVKEPGLWFPKESGKAASGHHPLAQDLQSSKEEIFQGTTFEQLYYENQQIKQYFKIADNVCHKVSMYNDYIYWN